MDNLPNGFTGFARIEPGFESAGEASRRSRGVGSAHHVGGASQGVASAGAAESRQTAAVFDIDEVDRIPPRDRRWSWVEIDASAIRHNVAATRRLLKPRTRLMAVVSANGYGHGVLEVSKAVLGSGADWLGTSSLDEAVMLRKAGITASVLLLEQPPAAAIPLLLSYNIIPSAYDPEFVVAYGEAADRHGMKAPYHLAINSGMNRMGVRYDTALEFLRQVSFHRALELDGIFTHYATAECAETLDFQIQTKRFVEALTEIHDAGIDLGLVHSANSAATYRFPEVQFDMVRCGLSLYGFHPCPETREIVELKPAMSVHARITDTCYVPMSEGVSYGLHYRSPGSVKICTVPIGYADGLRTGLSGNTDFVMKGRYFKQVGDICMNHCMFEADMRSYGARERIDPQVGDEVLIVGSQGIAEVTIDEMADKLGANQAEIAIGFSQRMERIYV